MRTSFAILKKEICFKRKEKWDCALKLLKMRTNIKIGLPKCFPQSFLECYDQAGDLLIEPESFHPPDSLAGASSIKVRTVCRWERVYNLIYDG